MPEILIGCNDTAEVSLEPGHVNRHGALAGAKGALAGTASESGDKLKARLAKPRPVDWQPQAKPAIFLAPSSNDILSRDALVGAHLWAMLLRLIAPPKASPTSGHLPEPRAIIRCSLRDPCGERGRSLGTTVSERTRRRHGMLESMGKQVVRTRGSQLGRQIPRGVPGGILGRRR